MNPIRTRPRPCRQPIDRHRSRPAPASSPDPPLSPSPPSPDAPPYAELHVTSNFSFLRGASHPEELVRTAHALSYAGIAITDRSTLAGIVRALQMQVHPPTGFIAVTQPGESGTFVPGGTYVGFWLISDSGDVPPRFRIPVGEMLGLNLVQGIALDPAHKEIFIIDARNNLLTYSFPQLF